MSNKIDVYYNAGYFVKDNLSGNDNYFQDIPSMYFAPEPVFKIVSDERNKKSEFLKCPAFHDFYKNCFLIKSPLDLKITIDKQNGPRYITCHNYNQQFYDTFIAPRMENEDFPALSIMFPYLFFSNESLNIEQFHPFMHNSDLLNNVRVISGKFDISKWIRPIDYAFEIIDESKPIIIKRGDPLYYIRFSTEKNINFIRIYPHDDIFKYVKKASRNCVMIKQFIYGNTLEKNYKIVSDFINSIKNKIFLKKSKCPFSFLNKDKHE
jgi:hypothetical protein